MDLKTALEIIKIENFKGIDDIEFQYKKELQRAKLSFENATNEIIKKEYSNRIEKLNSAFEYIKTNQNELRKKESLKIPAVQLSPKQKKLAVTFGIILIVIVSFFGVRLHIASNYVEEGLSFFKSSNYSDALEYFEKANGLGSLAGKYYYGKTLHRLNPNNRSQGFEFMKTAVEKGYNFRIDTLEKRIFNRLNEEAENFYK
ncbi:hypothetical protein [Tamlana flava]|uniref:hypothetical protein n=1 Tax=Tamlana flava TaxID=3158572 RepID=UPI00351B8D83